MRTQKTYTILLLLILLNIAVRIPVTPHEIGCDSFFIHWMAQSILEEGTALWLIHPASVFGLYPFSYPSFVPFLLATISNIMGLEIETIILIISSIFSCFMIYRWHSEITEDQKAWMQDNTFHAPIWNGSVHRIPFIINSA